MNGSSKYPVTLVESEEGFAVFCDTLPGCCSQGSSREEAMTNIRDAIEEYLAAAEYDVPKMFGTRITHAFVDFPETASHA